MSPKPTRRKTARMRQAAEDVADDAVDAGKEIVRGSSRMAKSLALIMLVGTVCAGTFLYANKETITKLFEVAHEAEHWEKHAVECDAKLAQLTQDVGKNKMEIDLYKSEVNKLDKEIQSLKARHVGVVQ